MKVSIVLLPQALAFAGLALFCLWSAAKALLRDDSEADE